MAATDQIVHLTKKFRKQKSSVSLSYPWNGPKFLTLDQNLRSYSQKTDFQVFGLKKFPQKIKIFETAASKLLDIFWFFSLCSLKVYIPRDTEWKFCPPIYSLGHSGPFWVWGLIQPPPGPLESPPSPVLIGLTSIFQLQNSKTPWVPVLTPIASGSSSIWWDLFPQKFDQQ